MGRASDPVAFLEALHREPWSFDFYQAMRRLECLYSNGPRMGEALRPADEPIRLGQEPALGFAPATVSACDPGAEGKRPRLEVRFFGLLGPNGPLPLHLTEFARERLRHGGDSTFPRFLDIFHHRLLLLFYRAWAQAQPSVSMDRPRDDRFGTYIGALAGLALPSVRNRDSVQDFAKLFRTGMLARQVRNAEGLRAILCSYFQLPVRIEQFVSHWMKLAETERTRLGTHPGAYLGRDAVIGASVHDRQHKFRIHLGPLTLSQYESFLPGAANLRKLVDWVRTYLSFEFAWDAQISLMQREVPETRLGSYGRLGWTTWLGQRATADNPADLVLDAEALQAQLARDSAAGMLAA